MQIERSRKPSTTLRLSLARPALYTFSFAQESQSTCPFSHLRECIGRGFVFKDWIRSHNLLGVLQFTEIKFSKTCKHPGHRSLHNAHVMTVMWMLEWLLQELCIGNYLVWSKCFNRTPNFSNNQSAATQSACIADCHTFMKEGHRHASTRTHSKYRFSTFAISHRICCLRQRKVTWQPWRYFSQQV